MKVQDPEIQKAAQFVLKELQQLSDTGIYETLTLFKIHEGAKQKGVYHDNTFLLLEFASPHLIAGANTTLHEIIVMESLEDGVLSFAIDEFPIMDEDAIEEFWMRKVDREREEREAVFEALEREAAAEEEELAKDLGQRMGRDLHESVQAVQDLHAAAQQAGGGDVIDLDSGDL